YRSEGVNYLEFECEPTACPDCLAIAADNPYPINKTPCTIGHPNCRCTWLAVEDEDVEDVRRQYAEQRGEKTVDNSAESGIIKSANSGTAVNSVKTIGKIDIKKYQCVTKDIKTDEVIITDERIQHIRERHPDDYEQYFKYANDILSDPDYILEANKPNTAFILKHISENGKDYQMILRLKTSSDPQNYKNSIITFLRIDEKRYNRYLRTKKVLYKSE
ncbi:MAG: PBECR2 nuclease fold domain-containing protein, partial [Candidatus Ornithomonoglobus sp.]